MNKIVNIIKTKETDCFIFKPTIKFYQKIKINRKRWGAIINQKVSPTIQELQAIAEYFNVSLNELI